MTRVLGLLFLLACHPQTHDKPAPPASRKGQKRAPETLLYVDGVARASLSAGELLHGASASLCDYLAELSVSCSSLRAIHVYRSGVASPLTDVTSARLAVQRGAAPRIDGVEVSAVAVYVEKAVPSLPVQGIPYLEESVRGGTRVNVDGRLAARLKRNRIEGALPELPGGYALADYVAHERLGVPRAVELVTADDEVVRVPDGEVANLRFDAEPEKHGQMSFRFAGRAVSTVAVNLYMKALPPTRELVSAVAAPARPAGFSAGCSVVW
jgi:hypothetical protein